MLLSDIVGNAAGAVPDRVALVADGRELTFAEVRERVHDVARWLDTWLAPGDTVAVCADNSVDVIVTAVAAPMGGHRVVFLNTRLLPAEAAALGAVAKPRLLIGDASAQAVADVWPDGPPLVRFTDGALPLTTPGPRATSPPPAAASAAPDDVAWLMHTSGTTGRPKTVCLTHRSLLAAVTNAALSRDLRDGDCYLFCFPLFHVAAYNVLHAWMRRATVVLLPRFDVAKVASAVATYGVTSLSLAPTMLQMLLADPDVDLSTVRTISYGAAPMAPALLRAAAERWRCGFEQGFGMTELSGNAVFLTAAEHRRGLDTEPAVLGAAGRCGPLASVWIRTDASGTAAVGEPGEIMVRGDQICAGYLEEAAPLADDGSFATGDVGYVDPDGYLFVVDRLKDIVITGGENVSSREVEDCLSDHGGVAAVAVIGVADPTWGERVVAVVVATDPNTDLSALAGDLKLWCRERLAGFKCPKEFAFRDQLPLNASGKVQKAVLRQMYGVATGDGDPTT